MPDLVFDCPYTSRDGHCPDCDGWTFHHILPVRYFWTAAFILAKLIRLQQCQADKSADLKAEFGSANATDFFADFTMEKKDVRQICLSLHRTPENNGAIAKLSTNLPQEDLSNPDNIAGIVAELTGPKYGGFAGMSPNQRTDDPKSNIEPKRPASFNATQWVHLQDLAKLLQRCMDKIASETNGPYKCTVSTKSATELLHHLRILKNDYGHAVTQFSASDWRMSTGKDWYYLKLPNGAPDPQQIKRWGTCTELFKLGDDALGGMAMKTSDLIHATKQTVIVARSTSARNQLQFVGLS